MKTALPVFHLDNRWLMLDGGALRELGAFPEPAAPAVVISDFGAAHSGALALEGQPAAAEALIEKRLRTEGIVDGENKVLLCHRLALGRGFKALYTAVPMNEWQRLLAWSERQPDHCLVLPLLAVMRRLGSEKQAVAIRHGLLFRYVHCGRDSIIHAETRAYSESAEDLQAAAAALGRHVSDAMHTSGEIPETLWLSTLCRDESAEAALVASFALSAGAGAHLAALHALSSDNGKLLSALPTMAAAARVSDSTSLFVPRLLAHAEQLLPWASAAALVAGAILLASGIGTHLQARSASAQAESLLAQEAALVLRAEQVERQLLTLGPQPQGDLQFLERLSRTRQQEDVVALLRDLSAAAGSGVRILRVRFDDPSSGIVLEGATDNGMRGGDQLARFVSRLRQGGFEVQALDPASGSQASGVFSYRLTRTEHAYGGRT